MGLVWRHRKRLSSSSWVNLSRHGATLSRRLGPITVSTRGRGSIRLGRGFSWRFKL